MNTKIPHYFFFGNAVYQEVDGTYVELIIFQLQSLQLIIYVSFNFAFNFQFYME